jgi:hypothetical protein
MPTEASVASFCFPRDGLASAWSVNDVCIMFFLFVRQPLDTAPCVDLQNHDRPP